jgi:hypothetical protein
MNENLKRIRRITRETQKRQEVQAKSKPVPLKALWQSKQYANVQSKVKQKLDEVSHHYHFTRKNEMFFIRILNDHRLDHNQFKVISFVHMQILDRKIFDLNRLLHQSMWYDENYFSIYKNFLCQ